MDKRIGASRRTNSSITKKFLDKVYNLKSQDQTNSFYKKWSSTYDSELFENGYITPKRCADALALLKINRNDPIIDIGCGTGLSGAALRDKGFTNIDGSDFSNEMLEIAKAKKLYHNLTLSTVEKPLNFDADKYSHVAAVGVFSPLHASPEMIEKMLKVAKVGCHFVFSLNDHTLENPHYEGRIRLLLASGKAKVVYKEYGKHLPKIKLNALIYVLERLK